MLRPSIQDGATEEVSSTVFFRQPQQALQLLVLNCLFCAASTQTATHLRPALTVPVSSPELLAARGYQSQMLRSFVMDGCTRVYYMMDGEYAQALSAFQSIGGDWDMRRISGVSDGFFLTRMGLAKTLAPRNVGTYVGLLSMAVLQRPKHEVRMEPVDTLRCRGNLFLRAMP